MRIMILAIFSVAFCLSWAEVKVEKVLETTSIKEYNQWVTQHKNDLPYASFIPFEYDIRLSKSRTTEYVIRTTEYDIRYYTENGEVTKRETVKGMSAAVNIPVTNDRILIYNPAWESGICTTTVKNPRGEVLFKVPYLVTYIGMELYVESREFEGRRTTKSNLKIFNSRGSLIGSLKCIDAVDISTMAISNNGKFAIFEGGSGREGVPVVFVNNKGEEKWRQEFREGPISVFIADNDSKIGIHHGKFVSVYLEDGSLFRQYNPFDEEHSVRSCFSSDGNLLAVGWASDICIYNNETGTLLWRNDSALAANNDTVRFLHIMNNGAWILALGYSHELYIFDREGNKLYDTNLKLGREVIPMRVNKPGDTDLRYEYVERPFGAWFAEFVGTYLIIIKGKARDFESRHGPYMRIVYKIVDE